MKRSGLYARLNLRDQDTFLDIYPPGEADVNGELRVDNPDGVPTSGEVWGGGGPYDIGPERGREYSQGAGTPKGNLGNASGMGKTMTLKGRNAGWRK
jgi:hypothetical protein